MQPMGFGPGDSYGKLVYGYWSQNDAQAIGLQ